MSSPWLQRSQQQQPQHSNNNNNKILQNPLIFRSATPPPRPYSASTTSPPRRHVIPRSLSVLHARPPPPRSSARPGVSHPHHPADAALHGHAVDYSAIQRIADGVERMVRSWSSEKSGRAHAYAKAYNTLNAAAARGKDQAAQQQQQQHEGIINASSAETCTPFHLARNHDDNPEISTNFLGLGNLQSPAEPDADMPSMLIMAMQPRASDDNLNDGGLATPAHHHQVEHNHAAFSSNLGSKTSGLVINADNVEYYNDNNWMGAALAPARRLSGLINTNQQNDNGGELLYTQEPFSMEDAKTMIKANTTLCMHNYTHNYPSGLGLTANDNQRSIGSIPDSSQYNNYRDDISIYDSQELARIQHSSRSQQADLDVGVPDHMPLLQQHPRHQHNNAPVSREDANPLTKPNIRSRSPSLRLGAILSSNACTSFDVQDGGKNGRKLDEKYEAKVKELEISLLECATEYEVQIVEMKMKMLQMKSEFRQKGTDDKKALSKPLPATTASNAQDPANVAHNNSKVNRQINSTPEVVDQSSDPSKRRVNQKYSETITSPKQKTRPPLEALQKKAGSEDSEKIVNCLQKLLSKKEQELMSSKIREKELAGQIHELQTTVVQRGRVTQMEPKKLLSLLLALNEWLQSVKAGVVNDDPYMHRKAYQNVHALAHLRMNLEEPQLMSRPNQSPRIENLAAIVNKEIKTLQEILGKLTPQKKRLK